MSWLSKFLINGLAAATVLLAPLGAYANLVFSYTGSPFFIFTLNSPYSPANHITFSFEVADPLPANLFMSNAGVTLLNWSYSDGLQTASSADASWGLQFALETDSSGTIIGQLFGASSSTGNIQTSNFQFRYWAGDNSGYEFAEIVAAGSGRADIGCGVPRCAPVPKWTVTDTAAVPEPGTLALFAGGLAVLALLRRRRVGEFRRGAAGA